MKTIIWILSILAFAPFGVSAPPDAADAPSDVMLDVSASVEECYVGQPFVVRCSWHSALPLHVFRAVEIDVPLCLDASFRVLAPEPVADDTSGKFLGLPVSGARVIARRDRTDIEGGLYETLTFERVVIPLRPGTFPLPPSTLRCVSVDVGNRKPRTVPSYFNNNFFDRPETDTVTRHAATSAPLTLIVKPLPEEGQPPDFSGQVGVCSVAASAAPTTVNAGDPVTLTISVSDHPFPRTVRLPDFDVHPGFTRNFGLPAKMPTCRIRDGDAVFAVDIRPLRPDVTEIPPVRFPFFDPEAGSYDVARTAAIPISVAESATTTAFDADLGGNAQLRNPLIANRDGIRHNVNAAETVAARRQSPGTLLGVMLAVPPICFLVFLVATARHRLSLREPGAARAQAAFGRFRRQIKPLVRSVGGGDDENRRILDNTMRAYFADRLGLSVQATCDEVVAELGRRGQRGDGVAAVEVIYRACDRQRFSRQPGPLGTQALVARATDTVRRIEDALRRALIAAIAPLLSAAVITGSSQAEADEPDSLAICREGNALFAEANQAALSDPDHARTLYRRAALKYKFLSAERGLDSAPLHGNLGNAYFFGGDTGQAIVHYHRALRRSPHDADVRHNLRYVRGLCIDELPRTRLQKMRACVLFWHHWPLNVRTGLFAVFYAVAWVLAGFLLYGRSRLRWWALGGCAVVSAVLLASSSVTVFRLDDPADGVVVAKEITARHGDGYIYESAFSSPLHAGTEFSLLEKREDWYRIALLDGTACWIPAHAAALIE